MTKSPLKHYKYHLALFVIILFWSAVVFSPSHITTSVFSIFPKDEHINKLQIAQQFESSSTLLIASKGFDEQSKENIYEIVKELNKLSYIKNIKFDLSKIEISDYMKKNYYLLSKFEPINIDRESLKQRLEKLKQEQLDSFIYQPIDKLDPFNLFKFNIPTENQYSKDGLLILKNYGYLLTANIDAPSNDLDLAKKIEKELTHIVSKQKNVVAFSPLFFVAQNSTIIKSKVQTILVLSFSLLVIAFFVMLKDYKLLIANTVTLASSIFLALSVLTLIFDQVSIFTLAFGSAISAMSVDYLFHNYFHNQYSSKQLNKSVFLSWITTILGLTLLQFVSFPLISQLAIFATISLSFAYFQFTFIYPLFNFTPKSNRVKIDSIFVSKKLVSANFIWLLSIVIIIYASFTMVFDYDLKNLDYDNKELKQTQNMIEKDILKTTSVILIEANNTQELILKTKQLKTLAQSINSLDRITLTHNQFIQKLNLLNSYDFDTLKQVLNSISKEVGFKDGYFSSSYDFIKHIPKSYSLDLRALKEFNYEILKINNKFYTLATIENKEIQNIKNIDNVYPIKASKLIKKSAKEVFKSLTIYMFISFFSIVILISLIARKKTIFTLSFILFPVAMILLYLSFFNINIMHLFALIIIIIAGIDYGIYTMQKDTIQTKEAIFYSLLTTFSGFGVLALSDIGAMHSIGIVVLIGILSILFLVLFLKPLKNV